jgi:hypothetical protein
MLSTSAPCTSSRHVLKSARNTWDEDGEDDDFDPSPHPGGPELDEFIEPQFSERDALLRILQRDPIKRVAQFVRYIRTSDSRKQAFAGIVQLCTNDDPELSRYPPLQLIQHVKTRWDSVYLMLQRIRFLKKVSARVRILNELSALTLGIQAVDMYFANEPSLEYMKLNKTDWDFLEGMETVLAVCS